jgi:hypothetical protein
VRWRNSRIGHWFFYTLFCGVLALTWFFHKDAKRFNDISEMWSDRAGYYIYLPATFFYNFDTHQMPADLDVSTGGGFSIDTVKNKLETKYTYGVSLMVAPFFLTAHLVSWVAGIDDENGFSMIYIRMMSLAAVCYLMFGLWFLKKFLDFYFQQGVVYFTITLIFLGTNLFYYTLIEGTMSHVYSFFLFSLFLFASKKYHLSPSYPLFILLGITLSLIILIRPTNILLGFLFFTWDASTPAEWLSRLKHFLKPSYILSFLAILFVVFMPQLIYWKYLSGNWLHFSYHGEGFTNWHHPMVAGVLFSPVNGLFTYTPLALVFIAGTVMMIVHGKSNGWHVAAIFLLVTMICASWKMWYFGCSFGQRSFIEYYAVLAVPFGYLSAWIFSMRRFIGRTILLFIIFLFAYFNLRYTVSLYRFDHCYWGSTWDWDHYISSVERSGFISPVHQVQSYENDFENLALSPVIRPSRVFTHSGLYSIAAMEKGGITPLYSVRLEDFGYPWPKMVEVEGWVLKPGIRATGTSLSYTLNRDGVMLFGDDQPIDSLVKDKLSWTKVSKTFIIPDVNDSSLRISIFMRNPGNALLYLDDLHLRYKYKWN